MRVKVIKIFPDVTDFNYNYKQWNRQFLEQNVILNGKFSYLYYPVHWTTLSLKFAFGGNEYYTLDKMRYSVNDSSYLILNRDSIYESLICEEKPVETLTLNFTSEFVEDVFHSTFNTDEYLLDYPEVRDKIPVNFFQKLYPNDKKMLRKIEPLRNLINQQGYDTKQVNEMLHTLLEYIFRTQLNESKQAEQIESKKRSTKYEIYNRLNKAKDYIHSNAGEKIDLELLGKVSALSPHHLLRKFRSAYGITPHQYLTSIRLQKAKGLLINSKISITEICNAVGFESLSSFSLLFKKNFSQSPEIYRFNFSK
jgi:AraC family transcriptional regulator